MSRHLALFDLDNTLLGGDSDHAWGEFLIGRELVDAAQHRATNDQFYADYCAGKLDIQAYVRFTLAPILELDEDERIRLHEEFMRSTVQPMVLQKGIDLVNRHRNAGDVTVIITATNAFITQPIAELFGVDALLATELQYRDGNLTGDIAGIPCYQEGKVSRMQQWLDESGSGCSLADSTFYSDSKNDLALLQRVQVPVAVDPDETLAAEAQERGWQIISLRD